MQPFRSFWNPFGSYRNKQRPLRMISAAFVLSPAVEKMQEENGGARRTASLLSKSQPLVTFSAPCLWDVVCRIETGSLNIVLLPKRLKGAGPILPPFSVLSFSCFLVLDQNSRSEFRIRERVEVSRRNVRFASHR